MHLGLPKPLTASHPSHPLTHPSDSKAAKIKYLTAFLNTTIDNHKPEVPASPYTNAGKAGSITQYTTLMHPPTS